MIYSTVKVNPLTKAQKAEHWSFVNVTILSGFVYLVTEVRTMVYPAVKLNSFFLNSLTCLASVDIGPEDQTIAYSIKGPRVYTPKTD